MATTRRPNEAETSNDPAAPGGPTKTTDADAVPAEAAGETDPAKEPQTAPGQPEVVVIPANFEDLAAAEEEVDERRGRRDKDSGAAEDGEGKPVEDKDK